jgi:hypothetical protein
MLLAFLLVVPSIASDGSVQTDAMPCSTKNSHPETGGYYIVGFGYKDIMADEDPNDPSTYGDKGQKADDYTWKIPGADDAPYPDAQPKLCTSAYGCSSDYSVMIHHTCSILRFAWAADTDSTVYQMTSNETFQACDFTGATKIDELDDTLPGGEKYAEYPFEQDAIDKIHYFASQVGCDQGQKVAVLISADYSDTYDSCYGMGTETARIQHCDCDHSINTYTMAEVCATGFVDGCYSEMPDDLSCCPDPTEVTYAMRTYTDGGNCIPKSQEKDLMEHAKATRVHCNNAENQDECDAYLTGDCPWWRVYSHGGWTYNTLVDGVEGHCPSTQLRYGGRGSKVQDLPTNYGCDGPNSTYTPTCDMWFMTTHCEALAAGETDGLPAEITESNCGMSQQYAAYKKYDAEPDKWDLWLETGCFVDPCPTTVAPTTATTPKPKVDTDFATLAGIGLILAVLS